MAYPDRLAAAWEAHLAPRAPDAPTVVSTFAGCGGSSLGYSMAGFEERLAVEWSEKQATSFVANFPTSRCIWATLPSCRATTRCAARGSFRGARRVRRLATLSRLLDGRQPQVR
ncbi:DNA cytosine methyltransferase [Caballeronia cordobensis]|uniref:DNA cytosine methyltransferase n=1 Tax=Caballeronia cordobensis TaxID=1353886 RepID=UPI001184E591